MAILLSSSISAVDVEFTITNAGPARAKDADMFISLRENPLVISHVTDVS